MDLLEECLQVLGDDLDLITGEDKRKVDIDFDSLYVKDNLGRIDWSLYYKSREVEDLNELEDYINSKITVDNIDRLEIYLIWDEQSLPIVKTELKDIIDNLDDVLAVSSNTWLVSFDLNLVIEFYHEGKVTVCVN